MEQMLSAVYEHGALRLLEPLELAESSQVKVQIIPQGNDLHILALDRQLMSIHHLLTTVEDAWDDDLVRDVFLTILRADLHTLWRLSGEPHRELCALLQLATARLQPHQLTHEQITVFRAALDLLAQPILSETEIIACHSHLIASGLTSAFSLNTEAIQSYVDEL